MFVWVFYIPPLLSINYITNSQTTFKGHSCASGTFYEEVTKPLIQVIPFFLYMSWNFSIKTENLKNDMACFNYIILYHKIQLNDYELRKGKRIGVTISFNNHRLFVGNIPKNRDREELLEEFSKHARKSCHIRCEWGPNDLPKCFHGCQ